MTPEEYVAKLQRQAANAPRAAEAADMHAAQWSAKQTARYLATKRTRAVVVMHKDAGFSAAPAAAAAPYVAANKARWAQMAGQDFLKQQEGLR